MVQMITLVMIEEMTEVAVVVEVVLKVPALFKTKYCFYICKSLEDSSVRYKVAITLS